MSDFLEKLNKWKEFQIENSDKPPKGHKEEDGTYYKQKDVVDRRKSHANHLYNFYKDQYENFIKGEPPTYNYFGTPTELVKQDFNLSWNNRYRTREILTLNIPMTGIVEYCPSEDLDEETYEAFKSWGNEYYGEWR